MTELQHFDPVKEKMQKGESSAHPPELRKISDSVWEFCAPSNPTVEIIFFHGIQIGNKLVQQPCLNTWTKKDSSTEYWPQTFFAKDKFLEDKGVRVRALTAAYDASNVKTSSGGRLDVFLIAENFIHTIVENRRVNVGQTKGVPVILVAHSFGGLLVKDFLMKARKKAEDRRRGALAKAFVDSLAGVFFYSTPHLALKDDVFQDLFPEKDAEGQNVVYSDLVPLFAELNNEVARLQEQLQKIVKVVGKNWGGIEVMEVFEKAETDLGYWKGLILEEGSGRSPSANDSNCLAGDHFDICRPADLESESYQCLSEFILRITEIANPKAENSTEAVNFHLPSVPTTARGRT